MWHAWEDTNIDSIQQNSNENHPYEEIDVVGDLNDEIEEVENVHRKYIMYRNMLFKTEF
jgi:hypothetical protein